MGTVPGGFVRDFKEMNMRRIFRPSLAICLVLSCASSAMAQDILPKHITPQAQIAIKKGLEFLAKTHSEDGSFSANQDGQAYPVAMTALAGMAFLANGNTPSRGPYADHVAKIVEYLTNNVQPGGLITGPTQEQGFSMYGHGFSLMFLSSCYGMETNDRMRERMKKIINNGIRLTAGASSNGGWCYTPGSGDEGSVTVTQIQGLRAASNAGFTVPKGTIEGGVHYLEMCQGAGRGHLLLARFGRHRRPFADLRRRDRHALQRRPIRFQAGRLLPRLCQQAVRSSQRLVSKKTSGTPTTPISTPPKPFIRPATNTGTIISPAPAIN